MKIELANFLEAIIERQFFLLLMECQETMKMLPVQVLQMRQAGIDRPCLKDLHQSHEVADLALGFDPGGHSKLELPPQPFHLGVVRKGQRRSREGRHQRRGVHEVTEVMIWRRQGAGGLDGPRIDPVAKVLAVVVPDRLKAFDLKYHLEINDEDDVIPLRW